MQLLYTDDSLVICIKPVGLESEHEVPERLTKQLGGDIYPVHRLDKNVGGVMAYARTKVCAANLSKAIQDGSFVKEYLALVHGNPPQSGDLQDFLFKDSRTNKVFVVKRQRAGVKPARLEFVRRNDGDPALVEIRLHTGRSHQIRVQFASRGYPLLGDHKYGARDEYTAPMLYSFRLTFPYCGKILSFEKVPDWA